MVVLAPRWLSNLPTRTAMPDVMQKLVVLTIAIWMAAWMVAHLTKRTKMRKHCTACT